METNGLNPHQHTILLVAISYSEEETFIIDCTQGRVKLEDLQQLRAIFEDNEVLGANLSFDYKMWKKHTNIDILHCVDVMVNEQMLYAGKFMTGNNQFSLAAITRRRLGTQLKKDVREEFIHYKGGSLSDEAYEYAAEDVQVLRAIYDQQLQEISAHKLARVFELECALIPVTATMELTGVLIDRPALEKLEVPFLRYIDTCNRIFQDMIISHGGANTIICGQTYEAVNYASKDQVIEALNLCGVDITNLKSKDLTKWDLKKSGRYVDLSIVMDMLQEGESDIGEAIERFGGYSNPFLRAYAFLIGAEKLYGTYVKGIQEKASQENVLYPWFRQLGARSTGRYSSNLQQLPKNNKLKRLGINESIRECIIARPDHVLIIADYAAIELVILADQSGDTRLAYEHLQGDLHTLVCNQILSQFWPIAGQVTKQNKDESPYKDIRDFSKIVSYGIAYGVTGKSLAEQANTALAGLRLKLTEKQGDEILKLWKEMFKEAGIYLQESAHMAIEQGYTTSYLGRKRFYEVEGANKWRLLAIQREGSNQRIQSTSADITKQAMVYFFDMAPRDLMRIVITIHDELVIECQEAHAQYGAKLLKMCMEKAALDHLPRLGRTVIIKPAISKKYDK